MNTTPDLKVGIDEITLTLIPTDKDHSTDWISKTEDMIKAFLELSKIESLFGEMSYMDYGVPNGYSNGLTILNRPWKLYICWHEDYPSMYVCVHFSAHAYAVYKEEYEKQYNTSINVAIFLNMIQHTEYVTRLSRIDCTADYFNYPSPYNPHSLLTANYIYEQLQKRKYIIKNHADKETIKTFSAIHKDGIFQTFYIGSRKGNTRGFLRCYDKKLEQTHKKGFRYQEALDNRSWIRFEAVFKGIYSHQITEQLLNDVHTSYELQQFIAKLITDKYRFFDSSTDDVTDFTNDLLEIASGLQINALASPACRDNSIKQSIDYIKNNSGLFSLFYKVFRIWGTKSVWKLMRHLYSQYLDFYFSKASKDKEIKMWLNRHQEELAKHTIEEFF